MAFSSARWADAAQDWIAALDAEGRQVMVRADLEAGEYLSIIASEIEIEAFPMPALADLKGEKLAALSDRRKLAERTFTYGEISIDLIESTQSRIASAMAGLEQQPEGSVVEWQIVPGVFTTFDLAALRGIGDAAFLHVQACFANAKAITALIDAAADDVALAAIDLDAGW